MDVDNCENYVFLDVHGLERIFEVAERKFDELCDNDRSTHEWANE